MLKGKTVLLGVSGGIAAYKIASLASMLVKSGADVHVLMTENAKNFINPITFETLTGNRCVTNTFDRDFEHNVEHVALAKMADIFMVAPATANILGKLAHGIADDMLTTTFLACKCHKILVPAMNTNMYENQIVADNIEILMKYGNQIVNPDTGYLACGDTGTGKMPEPETLFQYILKGIAYDKDMVGLNVLITAGPTMEAIDPVRFITNHSTGKMGYALAKICMLRGANVTLITGNTKILKPMFVNIVEIKSAKDMFDEVTKISEKQQIIIMAAAVADYMPAEVCEQKIKKNEDDMSISLKKTHDILKYLGEHRKSNQFLCGFSMETQNVIENSKAKLEKKKIDMIIANNLKDVGAGFGTETNVVTFIARDMEKSFEIMSKEEVSKAITDEILVRIGK